jgi:hypothetical protein
MPCHRLTRCRFESALPPRADVLDGVAVRLVLTQAVRKRFSGDRDEILNQEAGLRRNYDSPMPPFGFNCCAEGLDIGVFTQPGPNSDSVDFA